MKLFQFVQSKFGILGILPNQRYPFNRRIQFFFITGWLGCIENGIITSYKPNTFFEITNSVFITAGTTIVAMCYTILIVNLDELFQFIAFAEEFSDSGAEDDRLYQQTNEKVEKWSKIIYNTITIVSPVTLISPIVMISLYGYVHGTITADHPLEYPIPWWFDTTNLTEYLIVVSGQYIASLFEFIHFANLTTFGIGVFILFLAAIDELKRNLHSINEYTDSPAGRLSIFQQLTAFTQRYTMVQEFVRKFSKIYQPIFEVLFSFSLVLMCACLLLIQATHGNKAMVVTVIMTYASYAFGLTFIACELGHREIYAFVEINDRLSTLNWYLFSLDVQKIMPMIMMNVQKPIEIDCFGSITCKRESFKKIIKNAFSNFMVLRQFSH